MTGAIRMHDCHFYGDNQSDVKLTRKFQIRIPKEIREELRLTPGEKLLVDVLGNTIRLQRPRSIKGLRGIAKRMKWKDEGRDDSERF